MSTPNAHSDTCPYCGSADFAKGVALGLTAEVGNVGLKFRAGLWNLFGGTEPLWVDLCQTCGGVARLYVKEAKRTWLTA